MSKGPGRELREFDRLCDEHRKRFKKAYGVTPFDSRPLSVHIEILKEALCTGVPAKPRDCGRALEDGVII